MTLKKTENLRVALVHDWLVSMRGGERVLESLCEMFPEATVFTLVHAPGSTSPTIEKMNIVTSFIDRLPGARQNHRRYWPLFAHGIESFDFRNFDLVISSSSCVARGIICPVEVPHISYCHTPMRYVWETFPEYFGKGCASPVTRLAANAIAPFWRVWEESSVRRADAFIANSANVAARIRRRYGRDAIVIPPPVDTSRFSIRDDGAEDYYLVVSALVPYKRVDLAIRAFLDLKLPLKVVGQGPELNALKSLTVGKENIQFIQGASDQEVARLMEGARALIFPGDEDAGITPLESQAAGRPVVAFKKGGALETVIGLNSDGSNVEKATGIFFDEPTTESLIQSVRRLEGVLPILNSEVARSNALRFDRQVFSSKMAKVIESVRINFADGLRRNSEAFN